MALLDTDVAIDILRKYPPALRWLEALGDEGIQLPGYVLMELIEGCANKQDQKRISKTFHQCEVVWPDGQTCDQALEVFSQFHLSHSIGALDALIGQLAVSMNVPLQTFNTKRLGVIPEIYLVQPYVRTKE